MTNIMQQLVVLADIVRWPKKLRGWKCTLASSRLMTGKSSWRELFATLSISWLLERLICWLRGVDEFWIAKIRPGGWSLCNCCPVSISISIFSSWWLEQKVVDAFMIIAKIRPGSPGLISLQLSSSFSLNQITLLVSFYSHTWSQIPQPFHVWNS